MRPPASDDGAVPFATSSARAAPFDFPTPRNLLVELDIDEIARAVDQFESDAASVAPHRLRLKGLGVRLAALADDLQARPARP